ncbi:hypothetical protein SS1G_09739 [Sclerotinia sclerotiorum 1980 UF-70]|uniref:Histone deacetylase complex subunit SAP30 Sin3 binding domain-containing protein n=2 Tax=Sclerotinia sclerotiorum (strain ATCC 18683 / 1980 / Ss-1) TaxID=665079 RepID=A7EWN0_SCLS1|nr:hypothetical protein SS1G_09739 [Sclerotinia sclerotiorum 1980 UF-70]APA05335.1 hypothetical protein sscle_01g001050 [Sclerotinia sclerotiorum 1980 UF-70]EDN93872.1 hypothetical protein SS1G_09739 [Sclerotinia sclerotiorum 1980 UF-70]
MRKAPRPQQPDDSEASSTKEKGNSNSTPATNGKGKRVASSAVNANASGANSTLTAPSAVAGAAGNTNTDGNVGIQWSEFDPSVLHSYRYEHGMNTSPAFNSSYNQIVLSQSSIGRMSPTMVRKKEHKRQSKEQLANTVRKHFNSQSVNENDVIVKFLYKVRYQDKKFRMRFMPQLRHMERSQVERSA